MRSKGGRRRVLLTLTIASAVVVLILLFNLWLGSTDLRPDATTTSTTTDTTPIAEQIPLGVELTDDGLIRLYVPKCPSAQVRAVGWSYFPNLNTLWAIERADEGRPIYEFTVGVTPSGFSTSVEFTGAVDEVPRDVPLSFVVVRSTDSGKALPAATATAQLNELSAGSIRYQLSGETPSQAASVDDFQTAVGC